MPQTNTDEKKTDTDLIIMKSDFIYEELTEKIIRCFYNVYDELGSGFLESVYEKALLIEINNFDLSVENQKNLSVY